MNNKRNIRCRLTAIAWLLLLFCASSYAQIDTEFWFAVPYLTNSHDNSQQDGKGKICITSMADTACVVISQPAIPSTSPAYVAPISIILPPFTSRDISVGTGVNMLRRSTQNGKSQMGIHIESDKSVAAYFVQQNANSEIYTMKGRNALGTHFLVPQQTQYSNEGSVQAKPAIEIVATEDNTTISIQASVLTASNPNTSWQVTLNRGETYTILGKNNTAAAHLGGTIITSDKPIAVNTSDDSLLAGGSYDLVGDQLVPTDLLGSEYIAIKRSSSNERLYLFTLPNRPITFSLNGGALQTMAGGTSATITLGQAATYIQADDQFVAFQLTGNGGELGGTVLPQLDCTGSYDVVVKSRFTTHDLILLVKTPYTFDFTLNGVPLQTALPSALFRSIPNTGWSYCVLNNFTKYGTGGVAHIANSQALFHLSVMEYGGNDGTCSYGYFSGYSTLMLEPVANNTTLNVGDTLHLSINNERLFENVTWLFPDGTKYSGVEVTVPITSINNAGSYTVTATSKDGCPLLQDSVPLEVNVEFLETYTVTYNGNKPTDATGRVIGLPTKEADLPPGDHALSTAQPTLEGYVFMGWTLDPSSTDVVDVLYLTQDTTVYAVWYLPPPVLAASLLTHHLTLCDGDDAFMLDYKITEGEAHTLLINDGTFAYGVALPPSEIGKEQSVSVVLPEHMVQNLSPLSSPVGYTIAFLDTINALSVDYPDALSIDVLYDPEGVFAQKWDNVLAIYSPGYSAYGLTWTGDFQWYKNGMPMPGETGSYLHLEAATFDLTDYYQVEVTRLGDGVTMLTCPFYPHLPVYKINTPGIYDVMGRPIQSAPKSGFYIRISEDKIEKVFVK